MIIEKKDVNNRYVACQYNGNTIYQVPLEEDGNVIIDVKHLLRVYDDAQQAAMQAERKQLATRMAAVRQHLRHLPWYQRVGAALRLLMVAR